MKRPQQSAKRYEDPKRFILAVACFSIGFYLLYLGNIALIFPGFALMIMGAIIVGPLLADFIAEPAGNLFWPRKYYDRPQPAYSIPQSKRARGLYEEAMAGFEKIAVEYPQEVQAYIEMIEVAIVDLHDPQRARLVFLRGVSIPEKDADRETLARMYRAIKTRLNSRPGN